MDLKTAETEADATDLLVADAVAGDRSAMERLWNMNRRWLAVVLAAHAPRGVEVADLMQEVAVAMVRKIHTLKDVHSFRAWLRQVAINIARTSARRNHSMLHLTGEEEVTGGKNSSEDTARSESYRRILQLMADLPLIYREPLMLRAVKDMTYQQIARVLDLPVTTIETRITRGRRMLREAMENDLSSPVVANVNALGGRA